jgi:RimJ/RimL family protein N-acetyltransferase
MAQWCTMIQHVDLREIVLRDGRVTIRSAHVADEELLRAWFDDPDAAQRAHLRVVDEFTIWPFVIMEDVNEAGFLQVWRTPDETAGLEIFVAAPFRRRRLARIASALMARHLRRDLGWRRITVEPHAGDDGAIACFTQAGFVDRGARRDDGDHTHIILEWP